jgi:serine-type D-Ala-D-Ala carboxypeptidase/endopeptidase (penicillin-binding protein 4)
MSLVRAGSIRLSSRTDGAVLPIALIAALAAPACAASSRAVALYPSSSTRVLQLQRDIDAVLAAPPLARSFWGIVVQSAADGRVLYTRNGNKLLMPGSTMKIVTLAAAAERLGWDYSFETRLAAAGSIEAGVLNGDLVVIGSGDPSIVTENGTAARLFDSWAAALKSSGIHAISGRIIGDDNAFDDDSLGPGWTWDDIAGRDAAPVSGLQFNENVVQATLAPGPAPGSPASVTLVPGGSSLVVENHLLTGATGAPPSITIRRSAGSNHVEFRGTLPAGSEPLVRVASVDNPTLFFVTALRDALTAAGIDVRGPAVDVDDIADAPPGPQVTIATYRSPSLASLAVRLMKNSQNLYAETLLKALGSTGGAPTLEQGRAIVAETLEPWGVVPAELVQVDGSGLSRYNYVTADTLLTVLVHVNRDSRLHAAFEASLPLAGRDGTLAARMNGTAAEGNARAKSGTLANVRSLAGYVSTADGEPLVFVLIANNFGTMPEVAIGAIDEIVVKLAEFRRR